MQHYQRKVYFNIEQRKKAFAEISNKTETGSSIPFDLNFKITKVVPMKKKNNKKKKRPEESVERGLCTKTKLFTPFTRDYHRARLFPNGKNQTPTNTYFSPSDPYFTFRLENVLFLFRISQVAFTNRIDKERNIKHYN